MRTRITFLVFTLTVASTAGLAVAQTPTLDSEQTAFLNLINQYRAQNGAGPLKVSIALQNSSQWMSSDMAAKNYFSHTDSLGRDPFTRMRAFGYSYSPAGENLAAGYADAQSTLNQWINACDADASGACTYAHRKNMLNVSYTVIGIGRAYGASSSYRWYWTTDFGGYVDATIPTGGVPANSVPTVDSISPNSGTGTAGTFRAQYSDANGSSDLVYALVLFSPNGSGANACDVRYTASTKSFALLNDAGTTWSASFAPGSAGSASNSQCTVSGTGSSVFASGNTLALNLAITFTAKSAGTRTIYMLAQDRAGANTNWQARGTWTVPGVTNSAPAAVSVTPSSGTVSTATFRFVSSDANGYGNIVSNQILFNSSLSAVAGCYLYYYRPTNAVYLLNDTGTAWLAPVVLGSSGSARNTQCTMTGAGSSVTGSGSTMTLSLNLTFNHSFAGTRAVYMYVQDNTGLNSGWQPRGSIIVP